MWRMSHLAWFDATLSAQHWILKSKTLLSTEHSNASLASDHVKLQVRRYCYQQIQVASEGPSRQARQAFRISRYQRRQNDAHLSTGLAAVMWTFTLGLYFLFLSIIGLYFRWIVSFVAFYSANFTRPKWAKTSQSPVHSGTGRILVREKHNME